MAWLGDRLERVIAAGGWITTASYRAGLQGHVTVERYTIELEEWAKGLPPVRIVFASDFHAGVMTDPRLLGEAIDLIAAAKPDVLLLGGDFVSLDATYIDELAPRLGAIPAARGRYAVLGNHDYIAGAEYVASHLEAAGVTLLTNRHVAVGTPEQPLSIVGLDDHLLGDPDPIPAFESAGAVTLIAMHEPSSLLDIGEAAFRVAFCGHVHGGQVALPGGAPILVPGGRLSRRYPQGRFELRAGRTLIVSRGIGCTALPVRLFARPDVVVCTLQGAR